MTVHPVPPVVVAGAGPAGCAAAIALARQGVEVLVCEAARFPRDKVCGDVLLPGARRSLEELGVDTAALGRQAHRVSGCRYHTPAGHSYSLPFVDLAGQPQPWWVLPRLQLDAALAAELRATGAELREGCRVVDLVVRDGQVAGVVVQPDAGPRQVLPAAAVIGADGASSAVARAIGRFERVPAHLCLALRGYAQLGAGGDEALFSVFTSVESLPGCGWIVPLGGGRANVGVGTVRADLQRRGLKLRPLVDQVAQRHPAFATAVAATGPLAGWSMPGASLPLERTTAGLLLIGDAGGMVDPFTGHGIHTALAAGQLAGEVLGAALATGDVGVAALAPFDQRWRQRWQTEMWLGWALQRASATPRRVEALLRWVDARPAWRDLVGGLVGHAYARDALLRPGRRRRAAVRWAGEAV